MELLKRRIIEDGACLPGCVLKVDSFINHQMDATLMKQMAAEFVKRFKDLHFDKIITVEASGIAPAIMVGYLLDLPVLFVKKKVPATMESVYTSCVYSFTKNLKYQLCVSQEFLYEGDKLLFIDDFLAHGNAANAVVDLATQAKAEVVGMGFLIEKSFQSGREAIREKSSAKVESLAIIDCLENCNITFK